MSMGKEEVSVQDVSMTVVPPDRKKDDRRHKVWCKYYEKGICFSPNNWAYYNNHCPSSKYCQYYKEDITKKAKKKTEELEEGEELNLPPVVEKAELKYEPKDFAVGDIIQCVDSDWSGEIVEIKQNNKKQLLAVVNCNNGKAKTISLDSYTRENRLEFVY